MEPSKPLIVPDADTLDQFESTARKAARDDWYQKHPEEKMRRGKKSAEREAMSAIIPAWLELRGGEVTLGDISRRAGEKNSTLKFSTYKKYTRMFVMTLSLVPSDQLSENDQKLIQRATPTLSKKVALHRNALAMTTGQPGSLNAPRKR